MRMPPRFGPLLLKFVSILLLWTLFFPGGSSQASFHSSLATTRLKQATVCAADLKEWQSRRGHCQLPGGTGAWYKANNPTDWRGCLMNQQEQKEEQRKEQRGTLKTFTVLLRYASPFRILSGKDSLLRSLAIYAAHVKYWKWANLCAEEKGWQLASSSARDAGSLRTPA